MIVKAMLRMLACLGLLVGLAACGGGGGGGGTNAPTQTAPVITSNPVGQVVTAGRAVTMSVAATGNPTPTFQWERSVDGISWSAEAGATSPSYSFVAQALDNAARYRVQAKNSVGTSTSSTAVLTVEFPPEFTIHPLDQAAVEGQEVLFVAAASANPQPAFTWQRSIDGVSWTDIAGQTNPQYRFQVSLSDSGAKFRAIATNHLASNASRSANLIVSPSLSAPGFVRSPMNTSVLAGEQASFSAVISGNPLPTLQWETSTDGSNWSAIPGATKASIEFTALRSQDGLKFRLTAENSMGKVSSDTALLTASANPGLSIEITPADNPMVVRPGGKQVFTATVAGTQLQAVLWSLQGSALGVVSGDGTYQAPAAPADTLEPVLVVATSEVDGSVRAAVPVQLSPSARAGLTLGGKAIPARGVATETLSFNPGIFSLSSALAIQGYELVQGTNATVNDTGTIIWNPAQAGTQDLVLRVYGDNGTYTDFNFSMEALAAPVAVIQATCGAEGGTFSDAGGVFTVQVPPGSVAADASQIDIRVDRMAGADGRAQYRPFFKGLDPTADVVAHLAETPYLLPETVAAPMHAKKKSVAMADSTPPTVPVPFMKTATRTKVEPYPGYTFGVGADQWFQYINPAMVSYRSGTDNQWYPVFYPNLGDVDRQTLINIGIKSDYGAHPDMMAALYQYGVAPDPQNGTNLPFLFVHGYTPLPTDGEPDGGGEGTWGFTADMVISEATKVNLTPIIYEFKWKTAARFEDQAYNLGKAIKTIRERTGQTPFVIAHSFGGVLTWTYLAGLAERIEKYNRNDRVVPSTEDRLKAVITVGSPIGGIAWNDFSEQYVGLHTSNLPSDPLTWNLPVGRAACDKSMDSGLQLSMTGAGGPILGQDGKDNLPTWSSTQVNLKKMRGFYAEPVGSTIGRIASKLGSAQRPLVPVQILVGLGAEASRFGAAFYAADGDGLISLDGQLFGEDRADVIANIGNGGYTVPDQSRTYRIMSFRKNGTAFGFVHTSFQGGLIGAFLENNIFNAFAANFNEVNLQNAEGIFNINGDPVLHPLTAAVRDVLVEVKKQFVIPPSSPPLFSSFSAGPITWDSTSPALTKIPYTLYLRKTVEGVDTSRVVSKGSVAMNDFIRYDRTFVANEIEPNAVLTWEVKVGNTSLQVLAVGQAAWDKPDAGAINVKSLQTTDLMQLKIVVTDTMGNPLLGAKVRAMAGPASYQELALDPLGNSLRSCSMTTGVDGVATYSSLVKSDQIAILVRAAGYAEKYVLETVPLAEPYICKLSQAPAVALNQTLLAAGTSFSLALCENGTVWAWGLNNNGQLGNGTMQDSSYPVQVGGLTDIVSIAARGGHALALQRNGTVWAWGENTSGQVGDGTTTNVLRPVQVPGLFGAVAVMATAKSSFALLGDGTVWGWGSNDAGQLGPGLALDHSVSPVKHSALQGVSALAGGYSFCTALTADGTVWSWGYLSSSLGDGNSSMSATPIQAIGLLDVMAVAAGNGQCFAVKRDGSLWGWGANNFGQLGTGGTADSSVPIPLGLTGVQRLAAGENSSLAMLSDGSVWGWGYNGSGELGLGTGFWQVLAPKKVNGYLGVLALASGASHCLVLKADGTFWASGDGLFGQLGNGLSGNGGSSTYPVQVTGLWFR